MHQSALLGLLVLSAAGLASPNPSIQSASDDSIRNLKSKIKNVVVLVMENRSIDNLLGGQKTPGLDNPVNSRGQFCNPYNITAPSEGFLCGGARDNDSVVDDPDHNVYGNNFEFYGTFTPDNDDIAEGRLKPSMNGFVQEQLRLYNADDANRTMPAREVMNYYTEDQVPVMTTLVKNYLTFNHWHSAIPGPTTPNRVALVSGTSYGHGETDDWSTYHLYPQYSIWQQLTATNHTWLNYWDPKGGTGKDAGYFSWTWETGNDDKIVNITQFYTDAAAGALPELSWLNPSCCGVGTNSMHPSGLVSDGEELIRNVYNALRASPQWEDSLMILSFDETGGFYDHIEPPLAPRPDNFTYTETAPNGKNYTFPFDRLGGRVPTILISPWVQKAYVEQQGVNADGDIVSYSATSILRTLGYLWDFGPFNPRIEWSPSFDHLIGTHLRRDTPRTLPDALPFDDVCYDWYYM